MTTTGFARAASWLLEDAAAPTSSRPRSSSDEHRLMAQTTDEFVDDEVLPSLDRLESEGLGAGARRCCAAAASSACSASTCPRSTAASTSTRSRRSSSSSASPASASFATTFGGQANLCILPLVLFGTDGAEAAVPAAAASAARSSAPTRSANPAPGSDALAAQDARDAAARRQLGAERREDVDHATAASPT